jgi:YVTN family beta-propeller protein/VCBS repeat-containing protein
MRAARFVGRVGGLAVALGVGAAVSLGTPAAWADDSGSEGSEGSTSTSTSEAGEASESQDSSGSTTSTSEPDGGVHEPTNSQRLRAAVKDVVEAMTAREPKPARAESAPHTNTAVGGSTRRQRDIDVADAQAEDATTLATTRKVQPPRPEGTLLRRIAVDYTETTNAAKSTAVAQTPTLTSTRLASAPQTMSAAEPAPTLSTVVLTAMARTGMDPLASNGPLTPLDSPLELALFAIGARPRQSGTSPNGQSIDSALTFTALAVAAANAAPPRFESKPPIAVGVNPSGVVISADGRMFVANTGSASISVINTATGQRIDANPSASSMDISVGSSPNALALSADGKRLYVANTVSGTISVIDTTTYARIDANPSAWSMDIKVGASPSALAFGADGRLYVANRGSNTVSVINTATNTLVDINPTKAGVQSISVGAAPSALALGPNGKLYVANRTSNTVSVIDTTTYSVTNTIKVGTQPSSVALGADGRLYVVNTGARTLSVINTATNTVIDTNPNVTGVNAISVGVSPSSVALSPDGKFAYVANANDTVSVIDTATYAVARNVTIDTDKTGGHVIAVSPDGSIYVTDAADRTVRVLAIRVGNAAPKAGTPTIGTPNASNGAVTGALNFTDPDGDTLSYNVTQPTTGSVTVNATGAYTYTPTAAARQQARKTPGADFATFTVNATDGQATAAVNVTVPIAPAAAATGIALISANITQTGYPASEVFTPDGTRAIITTYPTDWAAGVRETRIAIVDAVTGKQIGTTTTLVGTPTGPPLLNADGTRAVITTGIDMTIQVTVINTMNGARVGNTLILPAQASEPTVLTANGTRAVITTTSRDLVTGGTRVAVIDTASGAQIGTTLTLTGDRSSASSAGSNAVLITIDGEWTDPAPQFTTRVAVINASTGAQAGTSVILTGQPVGSPLFNATGTRVVITTETGVAVFDTTTGAQIGATRTLTGGFYSTLATADAGRVLITTGVDEVATDVASTQLRLINSTTGTQIGATLNLAGSPYWAPTNANSTRALVVTYIAGDNYNIVSTQITVINTLTGAQTGTTLTIPGRIQNSPLLSADGAHALITASNGTAVIIDTTTGAQVGAPLTLAGIPTDLEVVSAGRALITTTVRASTLGTGNSQVALINMSTGAQIGTAVALPGDAWSVEMSGDGTRALVTTKVENLSPGLSDPDSTRVAVIDTITGKQVGTTITLSGEVYGAQLLSAAGTHFVITTELWDPVAYKATTRIVVIDTTTGKQAGLPVTIAGGPAGVILFNADGTRILITTLATNRSSGISTTRVALLRVT